MPDYYSTRDTAELFCTESWRIRRLFECGALPEPRRIGGRRLICRELLPAVADALAKRGWLGSTLGSESGKEAAL